jgi:hypothetical protein
MILKPGVNQGGKGEKKMKIQRRNTDQLKRSKK